MITHCRYPVIVIVFIPEDLSSRGIFNAEEFPIFTLFKNQSDCIIIPVPISTLSPGLISLNILLSNVIETSFVSSLDLPRRPPLLLASGGRRIEGNRCEKRCEEMLGVQVRIEILSRQGVFQTDAAVTVKSPFFGLCYKKDELLYFLQNYLFFLRLTLIYIF